MEFLDTHVAVPGARGYGTLRYYGPIEGKSGVFGGIELTGPLAASRGKNSGDVDGVHYFDVKIPMTGLFIPWERLKSLNSQLSSSPSGRVSRLSSSNSRQVSGSRRNGQTTPDRDRETKQEAQFYKQKYEQLVEESGKNAGILAELQKTVAELEPLLEEYERDLQEKDKKMAKQRAEFERARENWRESMDLMSSTQQETELFYEEKLKEIGSEVGKDRQKEIDELRIKLKDSEARVLELEALLAERENQVEEPVKLARTVDDILAQMAETTLNQLPVYQPPNHTDPSFGRQNWCGLCEQDGHTALECPYENEAF